MGVGGGSPVEDNLQYGDHGAIWQTEQGEGGFLSLEDIGMQAFVLSRAVFTVLKSLHLHASEWRCCLVQIIWKETPQPALATAFLRPFLRGPLQSRRARRGL